MLEHKRNKNGLSFIFLTGYAAIVIAASILSPYMMTFFFCLTCIAFMDNIRQYLELGKGFMISTRIIMLFIAVYFVFNIRQDFAHNGDIRIYEDLMRHVYFELGAVAFSCIPFLIK